MDLASVYARLPALVCQRKCQSVCGPIRATQPERERILRRHHRAIGTDHTGQQCRLLTEEGTCSVYEDRPLICRVVGLTRETACRHGCTPERWLTEDELFEGFYRPLFALEGRIG